MVTPSATRAISPTPAPGTIVREATIPSSRTTTATERATRATCVPECPINAIWPADELPAEYAEWTDENAELFGGGTMIKTRKDPLEGALDLAALQAREKERSWTITEPSTAGGDEEEEDEGAEAAAATGTASADDVLAACTAGKYKWRSARGIGRELNAPPEHVEVELEKLLGEGKLTKFDAATNAKAPAVYGVA